MLHGRQGKYLTALVHFCPAEINRTAIQLQNGRVLFVAPAQNGVNPQQKFLGQKGLRDIIVRSKAQPRQLVRRLITGRQKNHGNIRPGPELLHQGKAVEALARNEGRIVTVDTLCEALWGDNPFGYENSLNAHVRRVREKIEADPSKPVSLLTVKGLGYKLLARK